MNLKTKIIQENIDKIRQLAQKGEFLQSFLMAKKFSDTNLNANNIFYDIQIELVKKIGDMELLYYLSCKKFEIFAKKSNFNVYFDAFSIGIALTNLKKYEALSLLLNNFDNEKVFSNTLKKITKIKSLMPLDSPLDKLNLNTLQYWEKLYDEGKFEDIVFSSIMLHSEAKYYQSLVILKAYASLELKLYDNAIKSIKLLKNYDHEVLLGLIVCYQHTGNEKALKIYKERLLLLAKKNKIPHDFYKNIYSFYVHNFYHEDIFELSYEGLKNNSLSYIHLKYHILSCYNTGRIDVALEYLKRFDILYPRQKILKLYLEDAILNDVKNTTYDIKLSEKKQADITDKTNILLDLIRNNNQKEIKKFFRHQSDLDSVLTKVLYFNEYDVADIFLLISSNPVLKMLMREALFDELLEWEQKQILLESIVKYDNERHIAVSINYSMFFGELFSLEQLNKYSLEHTYYLCLEYFIKLNAAIDINLPLLNIILKTFLDCITSSNIKLLTNSELIASIILNMYFVCAFNKFPENVLYNSKVIKKEYFLNFNFFAKDFGLSIIDNKIYKNDKPINIIEIFKHTSKPDKIV